MTFIRQSVPDTCKKLQQVDRAIGMNPPQWADVAFRVSNAREEKKLNPMYIQLALQPLGFWKPQRVETERDILQLKKKKISVLIAWRKATGRRTAQSYKGPGRENLLQLRQMATRTPDSDDKWRGRGTFDLDSFLPISPQEPREQQTEGTQLI